MKKRVIGLLLCLAMILSLLGTTVAGAAELAQPYESLVPQASESQTDTDSPIWVRGVELQKGQYLANDSTTPVTDEPTGTGWAYWMEGEENVLLLCNFSGSGQYSHFRDGEECVGGVICCDDSFILLLEGENTITDAEYGIAFYGTDLVITGDGTLNIQANVAMEAVGEMNVEEIVYYPDIGTITFLNTTVNCSSRNGIYAASHVNIFGSYVKAGYGILTYGNCNIIGSTLEAGLIKPWRTDTYMLGSQVINGSGFYGAKDIYINSSIYEGGPLKSDYGNLYVTSNVVVTEPVGGYIGSRAVYKPNSTSPAINVTLEMTALTPFTDVAANSFYEEPIFWAMVNGVTTGISDTQFAPKAPCTRAQVVTFLWRAAGEPEPQTTENPFTDVHEQSFYYKAVLWAAENNITNGVTPTTFGPDAVCTRGQVVTFLHRAMASPEPTLTENPFTDVSELWFYYEPVLWAVESGITTGVSATSFGPDASCTRGQVVTFLFRLLAEPIPE